MNTPPEKRGRGRPATGQVPRQPLREEEAWWDRYRAVAEAKGLKTSAWVRQVLRRAVVRAERDLGIGPPDA